MTPSDLDIILKKCKQALFAKDVILRTEIYISYYNLLFNIAKQKINIINFSIPLYILANKEEIRLVIFEV